MSFVGELRAGTGLTQAELARLAGTSQPTISAYESGRKSPTLRTLAHLARAVGLEFAPTLVPLMTREDRRSLALHRALLAKLTADPATVIGRAGATLEKTRAIHPHAGDLLDEWSRLLHGARDELSEVLVDPRPRARDLRQVTPFAGLLTASERAEVSRRFRTSEADR